MLNTFLIVGLLGLIVYDRYRIHRMKKNLDCSLHYDPATTLYWRYMWFGNVISEDQHRRDCDCEGEGPGAHIESECFLSAEEKQAARENAAPYPGRQRY